MFNALVPARLAIFQAAKSVRKGTLWMVEYVRDALPNALHALHGQIVSNVSKGTTVTSRESLQLPARSAWITV